MAMTGKYKGTSDAVTVSDELETELKARIHSNGEYDDAQDVEFCSCSDGILIDIPVKDGAVSRTKTRHVLAFNTKLLDHPQQWLMDLKTIYDGQTPIAEGRLEKQLEIMEAADP